MSKISTGNEVIQLIQNTCDLDCGLVIQIWDEKERKTKFYRITGTNEAFKPEGSNFVATLVGELTDEVI